MYASGEAEDLRIVVWVPGASADFTDCLDFCIDVRVRVGAHLPGCADRVLAAVKEYEKQLYRVMWKWQSVSWAGNSYARLLLWIVRQQRNYKDRLVIVDLTDLG